MARCKKKSCLKASELTHTIDLYARSLGGIDPDSISQSPETLTLLASDIWASVKSFRPDPTDTGVSIADAPTHTILVRYDAPLMTELQQGNLFLRVDKKAENFRVLSADDVDLDGESIKIMCDYRGIGKASEA